VPRARGGFDDTSWTTRITDRFAKRTGKFRNVGRETLAKKVTGVRACIRRRRTITKFVCMHTTRRRLQSKRIVRTSYRVYAHTPARVRVTFIYAYIRVRSLYGRRVRGFVWYVQFVRRGTNPKSRVSLLLILYFHHREFRFVSFFFFVVRTLTSVFGHIVV